MSSYKTWNAIRRADGNRKRKMTYDEIQDSYLKGPQQQLLIQFMSEVESINNRLGNLERETASDPIRRLLNIFRKVN